MSGLFLRRRAKASRSSRLPARRKIFTRGLRLTSLRLKWPARPRECSWSFSTGYRNCQRKNRVTYICVCKKGRGCRSCWERATKSPERSLHPPDATRLYHTAVSGVCAGSAREFLGIRQAFLRGIPTRGVGRVVALLTDEPVSAQTVPRLTRVLDQQVDAFHGARLGDAWAYLILDGLRMKVRRAFGAQRVLLLVAYGVRRNGERQLCCCSSSGSRSICGGSCAPPTPSNGASLRSGAAHNRLAWRRGAWQGYDGRECTRARWHIDL